MRDDRWVELFEAADNLTQFYSEQVGKPVEFGVDEELDLWVTAPRTNGREYFETFGSAEDRVMQLYSELFLDDGSADDMEDL